MTKIHMRSSLDAMDRTLCGIKITVNIISVKNLDTNISHVTCNSCNKLINNWRRYYDKEI